MTVTIEFSDEKAAALKAQAETRGLTVQEWLLQLADQQITSRSGAQLTGAALVAAMQACPVQHIDLEPERFPMPVRDVTF